MASVHSDFDPNLKEPHSDKDKDLDRARLHMEMQLLNGFEKAIEIAILSSEVVRPSPDYGLGSLSQKEVVLRIQLLVYASPVCRRWAVH